ncbi:MAG: ABC transporter substrate-binding protein [Candidatus Thorarchaeota archaeon]
MERNYIIALVVIVIIVGSAGAMIFLAPSPLPTPARGDTIIWETIGNPEYMDPHVNYESFGSWIHYNVYETLYTYDWDSADTNPTVPLLAESYEVSADGLNWTFYLRQGIKFHDGTPFNASCVKYNFERVMKIFDGWGPAWMFAEPILGGQMVEDAVYEFGEGSHEHIEAYENWTAMEPIIVEDDYTVTFRLAYPYAPFLAAITYEVGAIISPTFIEKHGGITIGEHNEYLDTHTCGTGPYMLTEWVPDDHITLDINPNYWRATAAKADFPNAGNITRIIIKTNEEVSSRILNLQTGASDGGYWPVSHASEIYNGITGDSEDGTVKSKIPALKLWCGEPTYDVMFLGFNMNPTFNKSGQIVQSPFTIKATREAFSYAFDYQTYIQDVLNGFGIQLQGPIPKGMFGHKDDLFMYSYDIEKAVDAWNDAMEEGLDDILANMSYKLEIYYNSGNVNREKACLLLKDGINKVLADPGATQPSQPLEIDVVPLEWSNYLYQVRHRQLPIFFLGWAPDYADPDNYVGPFVKSTGTFPARVGLAGSEGWNATKVDGWITEAAQSQDPNVRKDLYYKIQEAIVDHVAYIWVYQATSFHVESVYMNGYVFNPMHDPYFYHYYKDFSPFYGT